MRTAAVRSRPIPVSMLRNGSSGIASFAQPSAGRAGGAIREGACRPVVLVFAEAEHAGCRVDADGLKPLRPLRIRLVVLLEYREAQPVRIKRQPLRRG